MARERNLWLLCFFFPFFFDNFVYRWSKRPFIEIWNLAVTPVLTRSYFCIWYLVAFYFYCRHFALHLEEDRYIGIFVWKFNLYVMTFFILCTAAQTNQDLKEGGVWLSVRCSYTCCSFRNLIGQWSSITLKYMQCHLVYRCGLQCWICKLLWDPDNKFPLRLAQVHTVLLEIPL